MQEHERRDGRTIITKKRRKRPLPGELVDRDNSEDNTNTLQAANILGEDFAREPVEPAAVSQRAIDLGNKRTQEIIGPQPEGVKKFCTQHGPNATRPGQVALVITDKATEYDPKTMNKEPCHVLRYENGALAYLPMSVPGCPLGGKPSYLMRRKYGRWAEWCYETDANGVSITHVTRLIKGRSVE